MLKTERLYLVLVFWTPSWTTVGVV